MKLLDFKSDTEQFDQEAKSALRESVAYLEFGRRRGFGVGSSASYKRKYKSRLIKNTVYKVTEKRMITSLNLSLIHI